MCKCLWHIGLGDHMTVIPIIKGEGSTVLHVSGHCVSSVKLFGEVKSSSYVNDDIDKA